MRNVGGIGKRARFSGSKCFRRPTGSLPHRKRVFPRSRRPGSRQRVTSGYSKSWNEECGSWKRMSESSDQHTNAPQTCRRNCGSPRRITSNPGAARHAGAVSAILGDGDSSGADADAAKQRGEVLAPTPQIRHTHETTRNGRTHTDRRRGRCNGGGWGWQPCFLCGSLMNMKPSGLISC